MTLWFLYNRERYYSAVSLYHQDFIELREATFISPLHKDKTETRFVNY